MEQKIYIDFIKRLENFIASGEMICIESLEFDKVTYTFKMENGYRSELSSCTLLTNHRSNDYKIKELLSALVRQLHYARRRVKFMQYNNVSR